MIPLLSRKALPEALLWRKRSRMENGMPGCYGEHGMKRKGKERTHQVECVCSEESVRLFPGHRRLNFPLRVLVEENIEGDAWFH